MWTWDRTAMLDFLADSLQTDTESEFSSDRVALPKRNVLDRLLSRLKRKGSAGEINMRIKYSFPNIKRQAGLYGSSDITFRQLYIVLCEHFNGGRYFIDDYFDTVYPYTVKDEVDSLLSSVKEELASYAQLSLEEAQAESRGFLSRVFKAGQAKRQAQERYEKFAESWTVSAGQAAANLIKEDIVACMRSGQLQLSCVTHENSNETKRRRARAGLGEEPVFYATGQLINSMRLSVNLTGGREWQTAQDTSA